MAKKTTKVNKDAEKADEGEKKNKGNSAEVPVVDECPKELVVSVVFLVGPDLRFNAKKHCRGCSCKDSWWHRQKPGQLIRC